jgi:ABC-2 type transport system permease protein
MGNLRVFSSSAIIAYKGLYAWLTRSHFLVIKVVYPLFQMAFFAYVAKFGLGKEYMAYAALGNAVQLISLNGIFGVTQTLSFERYYKTLPAVLITPAHRLFLFFSKCFVHSFDGVFSAGIGLFYGVAFFGVDLSQTDFFSLISVLLLTSFSLCCMGLLTASFSLFTRDIGPILNILSLSFLILCGVNFPVEELPSCLQYVSSMIPLTHGIKATRLVATGAHVSELTDILLSMLLLGLFFGAVGYVLFVYFEKAVKRRGTLELM